MLEQVNETQIERANEWTKKEREKERRREREREREGEFHPIGE